MLEPRRLRLWHRGAWHSRAWSNGAAALALALLLALFALAVTWLAGAQAPTMRGPLASETAELVDSRPQTLTLPGYGRTHASATLTLDLPPARPDEPRRVIWVPRDPVEALWIQAPGWPGTRLRFFRPRASEGPLPTAFVFPVPDDASGQVQVGLHASGAMPVALQAHVLGEDEAARWQQRAVALNVAVYNGCFMLALVAVALFWTVREGFFLLLFATCGVAGILFAAMNGHLYGFPAFAGYGLLKGQGLWALALLFGAALTALLLQLANGHMHGVRALLVRAIVAALATAGAVLMLGLELLVPWAQHAALAGGATVVACGVWLLAIALRQRAVMALPAALLFALLLAAVAARIAVSYALVPDTVWTRFGYQLAGVALLAVLALALMGRIGAYRQQRDDERDARAESERRMQREAGRAALARVLQARLRELAPSDVEWTAFRLLFEYLLPHVPADRAAVMVHGYHGRDVLVTEPIDDQSLSEGLQGTRLLMLKRQALTGRPLQHAVESPGPRTIEAVVPVAVGPQGWGMLLLQRHHGREFADDELTLAAEFVRLTVLHADEAVATQALRRTAERDALTGSHNRRSIEQWLAQQFARRQSPPLSVLFVDIDHFKPVNDRHGHACGDHCLRSVAMALRGALGEQDLLGRYGGEEFIVLLPGSDLSSARAMAERLRAAVEACEIDWQGSSHHLTVSVGVATRDPSDASPAALVERADTAMYEAKRGGRNQVSVSPASFGERRIL